MTWRPHAHSQALPALRLQEAPSGLPASTLLTQQLAWFSATSTPLTSGSSSLLSPIWVEGPGLDSVLGCESGSSRTAMSSFDALLPPSAPGMTVPAPAPGGQPPAHPSSIPPDKRAGSQHPGAARSGCEAR